MGRGPVGPPLVAGGPWFLIDWSKGTSPKNEMAVRKIKQLWTRPLQTGLSQRKHSWMGSPWTRLHHSLTDQGFIIFKGNEVIFWLWGYEMPYQQWGGTSSPILRRLQPKDRGTREAPHFLWVKDVIPKAERMYFLASSTGEPFCLHTMQKRRKHWTSHRKAWRCKRHILAFG